MRLKIRRAKMKKTLVILIAWVVWTLMCVYGTYNNTVKSAEPRTVEGGYEITFTNTGEIHTYTK